MPVDRAALPQLVARTSRGQTTRRILILVVASLATVALYWFGAPHHFFDLKIYMRAMHWWAEGNPLYDYVQADPVQRELYFTYPPFAALLLRPFAGLPLNATIVIFTALTAAGVVVSAWWLTVPAADRYNASRWFIAGLAVPLIFAVESTRETINFGQINMLLVVLILADLLFAVPGRSRWAGVGVGLATALKLYPGIFIIYLLAARRWWAAGMASATAAAAALLATAVAPLDSWRFWTHELWLTSRVGRPDYTGNQSLFGLLSRLSVPESANKLIWLVMITVVTGYGLWRAARAAGRNDQLAGLALTGLVGALISPITWTHHVFWFVPAVVVLADAGLRESTSAEAGRRRRRLLLGLAGLVYVGSVYGVVSFHDWGVAPVPTDSPAEFVFRNLYVLLALVLLVALPARRTESADGPAAAPSRPAVHSPPLDGPATTDG